MVDTDEDEDEDEIIELGDDLEEDEDDVRPVKTKAAAGKKTNRAAVLRSALLDWPYR